MKKIVITALIVLSMTSITKAYAIDESELTPYNLDMMFDNFYESPLSMPVVETEADKKVINQSSEARYYPLFKRARIKITNFFRAKENARLEKLKEQQIKELTEDNEADDAAAKVLDEFNQQASEKHDAGLQKAKVEENTTVNDEQQESGQAVEENQQVTAETIELSGEVKEQKVENEVVLDCDNIVYDEVNDEIEAVGSPLLTFPPQKVTLKADKMTYNKSSNILKAYGNVTLIKDESKIYGDYVQINMNEENAFMDNVKFKQANFVINTRKATANSDTITFAEGNMVTDGSYKLDLKTRMVGGQDFSRMLVDEEDKSYIVDSVGQVPVKVKADKIKVEGKKDHDTITLERGTVFYGDNKLFKFRRFTAHTDKDHSYFEANYPELGSRPQLGAYIGPGFVFDIPNGAVVKVIPFLNYKSNFGVGGALKYRSGTNMTELAYGSAEDIFVAKGLQRLDDKLFLQYGVNSYMDEGFMGRNIAKYAVELFYKDATQVKDTLAPNLDLTFRQKAGVGYYQNTDYNKYFGDIPNKEIGTTRFKYMAEINQSLFKRENKEELKMFDFSFVMQGSAALYGTGDTQFIGRVGPRIHTQYKRWMQDIVYYLSAFDDHTPMARFDTYRYGRSSLVIRESFRLNKYLGVGWSGNINLSNDAPNDKLFQENAFILSIGPDDFKVNLGYDFIRQRTYFAFAIGMDMKGSSVEFKKMEIKNPDRIAKSDNKMEKLIPTFEEAERAKLEKPKAKVLQYAEVIDIEDPDREQL